MTKNEKQFVKLMTTEFQSLDVIAKKINLPYEKAEKFADYLTENNLIRSVKVEFKPSPIGYIYRVAKPLKREKSRLWNILDKVNSVWGIMLILLAVIPIILKYTNLWQWVVCIWKSILEI